MNLTSNNNISRTHKVALLLCAILSFLPSMQYLAIFNVVLVFLLLRDAGLKYLLLFGGIASLSSISFLFQTEFHLKGIMLSFVIFSSLIYVFYMKTFVGREDIIRMFCLTHIVLSLIQFPIQLYQFIQAFGFNFALFASNSSAGDVAVGTIAHSAELAYKQLLSLAFLFYFRRSLPNLMVFISAGVLLVSYLMAGANHTMVAVFIAAIATVVWNGARKRQLSTIFKQAAGFSIVASLVFFLLQSFFTSQVDYSLNTFGRMGSTVEELGKVKAFLNTYELMTDNPILFFIGTGIGSYASRTAFILSGQYLWQGEHPLLGIQISDYFNQYMFPLWNEGITSVAYLSGTINQPFSSVLAIFSECGVFVFLIFVTYAIKVIRAISLVNPVATFLCFFVAAMLMVDNYLEYPRFIAPFFVFAFFAYWTSQRQKVDASDANNDSSLETLLPSALVSK